MNMHFEANLLERGEKIMGKIPKYVIFVGSLLILLVVSCMWRVKGWGDLPFWVDEFSTASQARLIQQYGLGFFHQIGIYLEPNNILTHVITAGLFSLFGESEKIARIPALLSGSLVPIFVYFLAKRYMPTRIAWGAGLLAATAHIQILWSLQARGYAMQQMWYVVALLLVSSLQSRMSSNKIACLIVILVMAFLTHYSSLFFILAIIVSLVVHTKFVKKIRFRQLFILATLIILLVLLSGLPKGIMTYVSSPMFGANNVGYYHSFLWREYGLVTFMGIAGLMLLRKKSPLTVDSMLLHAIFTLFFVSFLFGHHMTKYITGIFPYLYIGMAYFLYQIGLVFSQRYGALFGIFLVGFIILNGNKFVIRPKSYYSLNRDFREIANIDYDRIYMPILKAYEQGMEPIVIETWLNRPQWYLGNWYKGIQIFYWGNENGVISGHVKRSQYELLADGTKVTAHNFVLVTEVSDLERVMSKHKVGFLFIDYDQLPRGVIDYAEKNLKKEIFLDHYPLDDNPYSLWPATLYSWGFEKTN